MNISVVVCTYNYAHFLNDALRTLAAQTVQEFELLIVDDGSTDNTEQVVKDYTDRFHNMVYLKKPHSGLPDTRNFGVRAASGTHIGFLDADDLWSPHYLERMRDVFQRIPQAELVICDAFCVYDSGEVYGTFFPEGLPPVRGPIGRARDLFPFFLTVAPSALIFSKAAYERVGPFDTAFSVSNDRHWVIRAARKGIFCVRLDEKLVLYRGHENNLSRNISANLREWLSMYKDQWNGTHADLELESYARQVTRRHFRALLPLESPEINRRLLDEAIQAHGGDWLLQTARFLTYFGLCPLAKLARWVKRKVRMLVRPRKMIDLHASPERLFQGWTWKHGDTDEASSKHS